MDNTSQTKNTHQGQDSKQAPSLLTDKKEHNHTSPSPAKSTSRSASHQARWGLWLVLLVAILAVAGLWFYNQQSAKQQATKKKQALEQIKVFPISRADIKHDFVDAKKKTHSAVIPPDNIKHRFTQAIQQSKQAILDNQPSVAKAQDLSEDYLNIASSYSILGNYEKAEKWYLEMLNKWPKNYKANMNLGDLYILMGLYQQSANKYLDGINFYPHDFRLPAKLADLYIKYSVSPTKLNKADKIYDYGIKNADNPKSLYKSYAFFLENYLKDYQRALQMQREYQKITGSRQQQAIERLERMIK